MPACTGPPRDAINNKQAKLKKYHQSSSLDENIYKVNSPTASRAQTKLYLTSGLEEHLKTKSSWSALTEIQFISVW